MIDAQIGLDLIDGATALTVADVLGRKASLALGAFVGVIGALVYVSAPDLSRFLFAEILFATAVMFLYAWALPEVGFVISTIFATAYLTWRLGTAPLMSLVIGVATSVGIYVVFHLILGLALAKGPLGF